VKAVRSGTEPPVSSREGWENLAFIAKAYESMEKGVAVEVPVYEPRLEVTHV
jgi:hypothetical protein